MTTPIVASPAEILHAVLISMGTTNRSNASSWPSFAGNMPDTPDNLVVIYDTTPVLQGREMESGEVLSRLGILVLVRSRLRTDGWPKIATIHDVATKQFKHSLQRRATLRGETWQVDTAHVTSGPVDLGQEREGQRRFMFSLNLTLALTFIG